MSGRPGVHGHAHEHRTERVTHRHPHHHTGDRPSHAHAHTQAFERFAYLVSPVHDLDPRAKILAGAAVILGVVSTSPLKPVEFALLVGLIAAVTALSNVPVGGLAVRSLAVLPVALGIAVFAPLATLQPGPLGEGVLAAYDSGGVIIWSIVSKAWLSASVVLLVAATTAPPRLFAGLRKLGMPLVFVTMLTFLYRYASVLGEQVVSLRRAVGSRAPHLKGRRLVVLYGRVAGNLLVRTYERGERIYSAMLSRGFTGVLPTAERLHVKPADGLAVIVGLLVSAAVALY